MSGTVETSGSGRCSRTYDVNRKTGGRWKVRAGCENRTKTRKTGAHLLRTTDSRPKENGDRCHWAEARDHDSENQKERIWRRNTKQDQNLVGRARLTNGEDTGSGDQTHELGTEQKNEVGDLDCKSRRG
jgi:hypothetical protein